MNGWYIVLGIVSFIAGWVLADLVKPGRGPRPGQFWCRLCHRWTNAFICVDHNHRADELRGQWQVQP